MRKSNKSRMKLSGLRLIYYFSKLDSRSVTQENPTGGRGLGGKDCGNGNFRKGVPAIRNIQPGQLVTFFIWALLALISFFVVRDKMSAAVMTSLICINQFAFGVALGAVTVELFPREKIGQFCSAQAFFYQTIIMVLNPLVISPFFNWLKFNRAGYLWSSFFYLLAGLVTVKVYHNWKRMQESEDERPTPDRLAERIL